MKLAIDQRSRQMLVMIASLFSLAACTSPRREISGSVYHTSGWRPAAGVQLALVRNPITYPGVAALVLGIPQPVVVGTTTTDPRGSFRFTIHSDRQFVISPKSRQSQSDLQAEISDSRRTHVRIDNRYQPSVWFDAESSNLPVQ